MLVTSATRHMSVRWHRSWPSLAKTTTCLLSTYLCATHLNIFVCRSSIWTHGPLFFIIIRPSQDVTRYPGKNCHGGHRQGNRARYKTERVLDEVQVVHRKRIYVSKLGKIGLLLSFAYNSTMHPIHTCNWDWSIWRALNLEHTTLEDALLKWGSMKMRGSDRPWRRYLLWKQGAEVLGTTE